ncbi:MAG: hypothetical protein ABIJ56_04910 [Pseudomonadota bacterium]
MILLTSMLHRNLLKDIIFRWMSDTLLEEDCYQVKKIINFNMYIINRYLDDICHDMFTYLSGAPTWSFEVNSKGQIKDFILAVAPEKNERFAYIKKRYKKFPEDFYRSSPFHGKLYCAGNREQPTYLGHSRIKRFRRVAEKASRRMINIIFNQIKKRADDLAFERASMLGIPKDRLVTSIEEQIEEFAHAERRFIKELKQGMFYPDEEIIRSARIHDVAGIKVILEDDRLPLLEQFLNVRPEFKIVEKEGHSGVYNAVNYIIEYTINKESLLRRPPDKRAIKVLKARGLEENTVLQEYEDFIQASEDDVMLEVITSNYKEMIESELGRCMHEDRILAQREQVEYKSSIARNVRYITEYLFLFAISGKVSLDRLPIRLWEKAMPDTYDHAIRELWDIPTMPVL